MSNFKIFSQQVSSNQNKPSDGKPDDPITEPDNTNQEKPNEPDQVQEHQAEVTEKKRPL